MYSIIKEEEIDLYADALHYLPDKFSKEDVATLLETYENATESGNYTWENIMDVYFWEGHYYFMVSEGFSGKFNLFKEIQDRFNEEPISVINANAVAPRHLSRGIQSEMPPKEDISESDTGFLVPEDVNQLPQSIGVSWYLLEESTGTKIPLTLNPVTIGRSKTADVQVKSSIGVSRKHAEVSIDPSGEPQVKDLQSSNGTYLNKIRIPTNEEIMLKEGDYLNLYDKLLRVIKK